MESDNIESVVPDTNNLSHLMIKKELCNESENVTFDEVPLSVKHENPWAIHTIYELQYYNCPSCLYKNHSKKKFIDHAYEAHPESVEHLSNIGDGSLSDINCPWKLNQEEIIKKESTSEPSEEYFEYSMGVDSLDYYDQFNHDEDDQFFQDLDYKPSKPKKRKSTTTKKSTTKKSTSKKSKKANLKTDSTLTTDDFLNIPEDNNGNEEAIAESSSSVKKMLACGHCPKEFPTPSKLKRHVTQIHLGIKNYQCDRCERAFGEAGHLKKHIAIVHEGQKNYQCDRCDYRCGTFSNLKNHISLVHEGIKPFKCDLCEKRFGHRGEMKRHISCVHEGIKKFQCDKCEKSYKDFRDLNIHMYNVHENQKDSKSDPSKENSPEKLKTYNYKCHYPECGKAFMTKRQLADHIPYVHEGVKQYSCDRCEKTFGTGKSLKRHISIIHLGERKFPCLECGKAFGRSSHLNKHVLFVHKGLKSTHEDTSTNTKLLDIVH